MLAQPNSSALTTAAAARVRWRVVGFIWEQQGGGVGGWGNARELCLPHHGAGKSACCCQSIRLNHNSDSVAETSASAAATSASRPEISVSFFSTVRRELSFS